MVHVRATSEFATLNFKPTDNDWGYFLGILEHAMCVSSHDEVGARGMPTWTHFTFLDVFREASEVLLSRTWSPLLIKEAGGVDNVTTHNNGTSNVYKFYLCSTRSQNPPVRITTSVSSTSTIGGDTLVK